MLEYDLKQSIPINLWYDINITSIAVIVISYRLNIFHFHVLFSKQVKTQSRGNQCRVENYR